MKLIVLPFAGGSKHSYNYLEAALVSKGIELVSIGYFDKTKNTINNKKTIQDIANQVLESITEIVMNERYVIYGHSMGALVGYEICKKITQQKLPLPVKLVVSGRNAPCYSKNFKTYTLSSENFWDTLNQLGGLPQELLKEKNIRKMFEPSLRRDFECAETYTYQGLGKLSVPIDVFYGTEEGISFDHINDWKKETSGNVNITELTGNHFFIFDGLL